MVFQKSHGSQLIAVVLHRDASVVTGQISGLCFQTMVVFRAARLSKVSMVCDGVEWEMETILQ